MLDIAEYLDARFEEVNYYNFYRELFPIGSFEKKGVYECGRYNGIAVAIQQGSKKVNRYTITDDLDMIENLVESDDFCLMSPISYVGKSRKSINARFLYALAIDLDGIERSSDLETLFIQIEGESRFNDLPCPTYLISSGTGLHIYYILKKPIALFPNIVKELEKLKHRLTFQAWAKGASRLYDHIQYESLFQGFRMVGSITKKGTRTRAFKVGDKVDIDYLNYYVPDEDQAHNFTYKSELTRQQAKEKFPEWYKRRVEKKQPKGSWQCNRAVYDWWKEKIISGWSEGHRYWCILTLATYAVKCGISYKELQNDAFSLMSELNKGVKQPFTEDDVIHALEAYNDNYVTYPIDTITSRTDIPIEKNKRNGRKQKIHLERARAVQKIDYPNGEWRNKNGRPTAKNIVFEWKKKNSNAKPKDCIKETGLSKNTVYKWWKA